MQAGLNRMSTTSRRKAFQGWQSPYEITSVQAGEVEAVHKATTENVYKQHLVEVEGQSDILTMGLPYICPYNVNSIMNPILVACLGLGYFFNMYKGKPLVRKGGVVIMTHPTPWDFHPVHHPSYIDFFERVLSETTDPVLMSQSTRNPSPKMSGTGIYIEHRTHLVACCRYIMVLVFSFT